MRVFWCFVLFLGGALIFFLSPVYGEVQVYVEGGTHPDPVHWSGEPNPGQTGVNEFSVHDVPDGVIPTAKNGGHRILPELGRGEVVAPLNISDLQVDFSGAPTSGRVPLRVFFTDLTKGSPEVWSWDFGDGSTGTGEDIIHTYSKVGIYTVSLTASSQAGGSGTRVKEGFITVNPVGVDANFSAKPLNGTAPLSVEFTDHSTGAMIWSWVFGDGSPGSMTPSPTHIFSQPGTYSVRLSVADELGHTDSATQEINVSSPGVLEADFVGTPLSGSVPLSVRFTDRSTGDPLSLFWNFGDGATDMGSSPVHTYQTSGLYPVTLTIRDKMEHSDTEQKIDYISVLDLPGPTGSMPVSAGWNFVSVPKKLASGRDTAAIFENIDADGHSLLQYDSGTNKWIILTQTSLIKPLDAVWLYSKKIDTVPLTFDPDTLQDPPTKDLRKGWNAIGFTGLEPQTAKNTLTSVQNTWLNCLGFNRELQRYDAMIIKGENDDTPLRPCTGYWLYMSAEGVLTGFS